MMRFLPTYQAVESMRRGMSPTNAARDALSRVGRFYPSYLGALVCVAKNGTVGAASWGWTFTYSYASAGTDGAVKTVQVPAMNKEDK